MAARARRAVLIAGPTASGKSGLALELAANFDATIINADSMQVYRDLRVITARPKPAEEAQASHRLYGHVDAAEPYSTGHWLRDVQAALAETERTGRTAILVGGTGLYFKLLTEGIALVPPIPPEIRTALRNRLRQEGSQALHAELARHDPASAARLSPGDRSRVVRELEVIQTTGRPLHAWHDENTPPLLSAENTERIFLAPDRDTLRMRIDARFDAMLQHGALGEVRALAARGLDPLLPAMKAHGVLWLIRHLCGDIGISEAAEGAKADTRRYAKRQFTWFRTQLPDWRWEAPDRALDTVLKQLAL